MNKPIHINSLKVKELALKSVFDIKPNGEYEVTIRKLSKTRTSLQNRALHKWLGMVAEALNGAGWSYYVVLLRKPLELIENARKSFTGNTDYEKGYLQAMQDIYDVFPKAEVSWTANLVKENLWRPVQKSQIGKESTADADRVEYTIVYENLNSALANGFGVSIPWPVDERKAELAK